MAQARVLVLKLVMLAIKSAMQRGKLNMQGLHGRHSTGYPFPNFLSDPPTFQYDPKKRIEKVNALFQDEQFIKGVHEMARFIKGKLTAEYPEKSKEEER